MSGLAPTLMSAGARLDSAPLETARLRVAVVDEEPPYPLDSGKRIRTFELLSRLASRHDITLLAHEHAQSELTREAVAALQAAGIECRLAPRQVAAKQGAGFYGRLAANLLSPRPYSVDSNCTPALRALVAQAARQESFDLWHVEWTPLAELATAAGEAPRVVVAHNIETLIWRRYRTLERNPFKRAYIAEQARKFERFERRALSAADRVVTVSQPDAELAREFGARHPVVVDNGVDTARFEFRAPAAANSTLLFLGSLDWRPNQDAIAWLLDSIWPPIGREKPGARLSIVGRRPPQWLVDRCRQAQGVELAADVPDVRPYLEQATAMIVPLRVGGGSRLKILEALAAGLPVVSTTIGAEGLSVESGRHLLVADQTDDIAHAATRLLRERELRHSLAAAGRQLVEERYDWTPLAQRLELGWQEAVRCRRS